MSKQFDDDFAPLRKAVRDANSNTIVKDSRVDADQMMRIKKIPLFNSKRSGNITMSSNKFKGKSLIKNQLSTHHAPKNTTVEKQHTIVESKDTIKLTISKINFTPLEQITITMVIKELQNKICPNIGEGNVKQGWGKFVPSSHLSSSYMQIADTLSQLIEPYSSVPPIECHVINLIDSQWKYIHAGYAGLHLAIQNLKDNNPNVSFIAINSQHQTGNPSSFLLTQLMSQLYCVDPTFIDIIKKTSTYNVLEKHIIDLIQYSDTIETLERKLKIPKRTFLLFIDRSDCLASFYHQIIDELTHKSSKLQTVYIKLSDIHQDGYKNINFQDYIIGKKEYFDEVIENLMIIPTDNTNQFVDVFNNLITDESYSTHTLLRNYISSVINSCYQYNMSSMDCSQSIIRELVSHNGK